MFNRPSTCKRPDSYMCIFFFLLFLSFYLFRDVAFSECFLCTISAFFFYGEYVVRSFLPNGVFLSCDQGLDF